MSRSKRTSTLDVFEYLDYRAYLRDFYQERKDRGRGFSFRAFSRRAGLRSPNYLKLVMEGDRNLTTEMAARFAEACGLSGESTAYFVDLVQFNQAKGAEERNEAYKRLTGFRKYRSAHRIDVQQAAYYSVWYMQAVRELAARHDFNPDPTWIAARLLPTITPAEAARALDTLLELGLLVRDAAGNVAQGEPLVSTGPETKGIHIVNYHRTMMDRAFASIDLVPPQQRDISSLTICMGPQGLRSLKERVQRFRRELLELSALEEDPRQVIQLNFQLFPLSSAEDGDDGDGGKKGGAR